MSATDAVTEKSSELSSFGREVSFWSTWLFGTALSTVAVISFIQIVFHVPLVPTYSHGLAVYREVVHSIFGFLYVPFVYLIEWVASRIHFTLRITIPAWWNDLAALSMVSTAAFYRANYMVWRYRARWRYHDGIPLYVKFGVAAVIFCFGVTLFGLMLIFFLFPTSRLMRALNRAYTRSLKA
jgi:hypothetical protein